MLSRFPSLSFVVVAIVSCVAFAQTAAPPPATNANVEHLKATITGVEGKLAFVRLNENAEWQEAKVGMEVGENAEFKTGPKSAVRFTIPPDQTITLDRLGTVKLLQAIDERGENKTKPGER